MMISLTTLLAPQRVHALGRWDEERQAEPMRETAAASRVQCCAHRHPAADCDKLGASGQGPYLVCEGRDTHRLCHLLCPAAPPQTCMSAAIRDGTSKHLWEQKGGRMDRGVHP